jgi:hypothetical protein
MGKRLDERSSSQVRSHGVVVAPGPFGAEMNVALSLW